MKTDRNELPESVKCHLPRRARARQRGYAALLYEFDHLLEEEINDRIMRGVCPESGFWCGWELGETDRRNNVDRRHQYQDHTYFDKGYRFGWEAFGSSIKEFYNSGKIMHPVTPW